MALKRTLTVSRFATFALFALIGLVVAYVTLNSLKLLPPIYGAPNSAPLVIPSLREWHGGNGNFTLTQTSRIAVDPAAPQLATTATTFQSDLHALTGATLPVVTTSNPATGDFYLTLRSNDKTIGNEGYLFNIADFAVISANTPTGVFYGTRTALQILAQDSQHASIPRGSARDYPAYAERGFMLDVGRKFFSISYLEDIVRQMAWYKMNDFHLHLNDNELDGGTHPDWQQRYAAFRLNSPAFKGLAAPDGSYTQQDMRALQDVAKQYAVTITPEIDMPAHDLALTQYRPDLASPNYSKEFLNLEDPNTYTFLNSLWDTFLPWFDAKQIDIGADEYATSDADNYRKFINRYDNYLKAKGKTVRMWGSLSMMRSATPVNTDITLDLWDNDWANPVEMVHDGFNVINANGNLLYIVPKAGYYHDYLNTRLLYDQWQPYIFDLNNPALNLKPGDPHLLGGMFSLWNDRLGGAVTNAEVDDRITPAMQTTGQKLWSGPNPPLGYDQFIQLAKTIGPAPNTHLPQLPPATSHTTAPQTNTVLG